MKIASPLPHKKGRIEIIPLIDIMFFLLAAFMVVSINKIKIDSLKINLPTDVPSTQHETKEDFISISIDEQGQVAIDKDVIPTKDALVARLSAMYAANKEQKILISADREAKHGDVMTALGMIRQAGFQKVAFSIKKEPIAMPDGGLNETDTVTPPTTPTAGTPPGAPGTTATPESAEKGKEATEDAAPATPGVPAPQQSAAPATPPAPATPNK